MRRATLYSAFCNFQNYNYAYGVSDGEKLSHVRVVFLTLLIIISFKYIRRHSVECQTSLINKGVSVTHPQEQQRQTGRTPGDKMKHAVLNE